MGDKNLEDGDIEPAPKLIQVLFQNCRGQVDHWVEPYLRITVERLRRTEKPYLKCLLMEVVMDVMLFSSSFPGYLAICILYNFWDVNMNYISVCTSCVIVFTASGQLFYNDKGDGS